MDYLIVGWVLLLVVTVYSLGWLVGHAAGSRRGLELVRQAGERVRQAARDAERWDRDDARAWAEAARVNDGGKR